MLDYLLGPSYLNPVIRAAATITKDLYEGRSFKDNSYSDWLSNGQWDENKYVEYLIHKNIPGISNYTTFLENLIDDQSYMKNHGLDWDDVKRPWKLKTTQAASHMIGSSLNFVSKNIEKLY